MLHPFRCLLLLNITWISMGAAFIGVICAAMWEFYFGYSCQIHQMVQVIRWYDTVFIMDSVWTPRIVSCVQTLYYFTRYPKVWKDCSSRAFWHIFTWAKDVWYIKGIVHCLSLIPFGWELMVMTQVALVWIFDTIHQCLICHTGSFSGVSPEQYRTW